MKLRKHLVLGAAVVGVLALSSCSAGGSGGGGSDSESSAELTAWFMRDDVPDAAQEWLKTEWAERNDGAELTIEIQDWDGIVTKLIADSGKS